MNIDCLHTKFSNYQIDDKEVESFLSTCVDASSDIKKHVAELKATIIALATECLQSAQNATKNGDDTCQLARQRGSFPELNAYIKKQVQKISHITITFFDTRQEAAVNSFMPGIFNTKSYWYGLNLVWNYHVFSPIQSSAIMHLSNGQIEPSLSQYVKTQEHIAEIEAKVYAFAQDCLQLARDAIQKGDDTCQLARQRGSFPELNAYIKKQVQKISHITITFFDTRQEATVNSFMPGIFNTKSYWYGLNLVWDRSNPYLYPNVKTFQEQENENNISNGQ